MTTVAIADDHKIFCDSLQSLINDFEGFSVIWTAQDGDQALEMFRQKNNQPQILLLDINMPGKNGYDILEGIRTSPVWSHIPVIITSTSSTGSIIDKCLNAGAADYIIKPDTFIDYRSFVKRLYDVIEGKQLVK